jgi:hypothetical protein
LEKVQSRQGDGTWGKFSRQLTAHGFNATGILLFWNLHKKVFIVNGVIVIEMGNRRVVVDIQ